MTRVHLSNVASCYILCTSAKKMDSKEYVKSFRNTSYDMNVEDFEFMVEPLKERKSVKVGTIKKPYLT